MQIELVSFITNNHLFDEKDRLLLAASGGVDSMVMTHLFANSPYQIGIAHCNFQLRGDDSNGDAELVKQTAEHLGVPFYSKDFSTAEAAKDARVSIQMMARSQRYEWLNSICEKHRFKYILTAHHLDDSIETLLLNFLRGTGISGLGGVPLRSGNTRRPLLFANREDILAYADKEKVAFREDASNASDKYQRNYLRHHILPHLYSLQPALKKVATNNFSTIGQSQILLEQAAGKWKEDLTHVENKGELHIDKIRLQNLPFGQLLLWEWLSPKGFDAEQIRQCLTAQTGTVVKNEGWEIYISSVEIILKKNDVKEKVVEFFISDFKGKVELPDGQVLSAEKVNLNLSNLQKPKNEVIVDISKVQFPVKVRRWEQGDTFCPLGMEGRHQKLQDFFTNKKMNAFEKTAIWILENGDGKIIWVIDQRLDDRFKLTPPVSSYWHLCIENKKAASGFSGLKD